MQDESAYAFGAWLKQRRHELDLTREELARRASCSAVTIRKIEEGGRRPSKQMAEALANVFSIPAEERAGFVAFARAGQVAESASAVSSASARTPWRRRARSPTNVPVPLTSLIGREREVAAVINYLLRDELRLVTLSGPPGIGKTRLGLRVAAELNHDFEDGVFFIPLAPITDPALVIPTIAKTLGVQESSAPLLANVAGFLRSKHVLLLLDNFEQVIAAAPQLVELLSACPLLKALVTSREVLNVRGEHVFAVPPLELPQRASGRPVGELSHNPAVALFVARAQALKSDLVLSEANAPTIVEICLRLDGLPLAIELAAARVNLFSPEQIRERLHQRLELLAVGPRDSDARHHTLRAAIAWSYDLLHADEQRLFARLSVFVGGATLGAIRATCARGMESHLLNGIESLLAKNLLRRDEPAEAEARFSMLETIREFARERLGTSGEEADLRRAHVEYFLALAEEAEPHFLSADVMPWLVRADAELDNIRAALGSTFEGGDAESALRMAGALWWFWRMRGQISEGRKWLEGVLALPGAEAQPRARGKALEGLVVFARYQDDTEREASAAEECLRIYRGLGDLRGMGEALNLLGRVAIFRGDYPTARTYLEDSLALQRELNNQIGMARTLISLSQLARCLEDFTWACACCKQALRICEELGRQTESAIVLLNYGHAELGRGAFREGFERFTQSVQLYRELNVPKGLAECMNGLGAIAVALRQPQRAATLFGAAESLFEAVVSRHLDRPDLIEYERALSALRHQLDAAAITAAWARGRALNQEQAIEFALANDAMLA